jgi:SAM-dependent methyltransferase
MIEIIPGHLYDYPKYYDLVFGSDWKAEFDFLETCFQKHSTRRIRRLFEPACGTGRLLIKFADSGYDVVGNDLNAKAVAYCNARFERRGFQPAAVVGDMADFQINPKADAAYNMINSFRHLPAEDSAEGHLNCVARALAKGGIYVLGLHLTPTRGDRVEQESWSARRGNLAVISSLWSDKLDLRARNEEVCVTFDVYTPTRRLRITDRMNHRTYTARQMQRLLQKVSSFDVVATYDFLYELDSPITIGPETEDVVYVLRKN